MVGGVVVATGMTDTDSPALSGIAAQTRWLDATAQAALVADGEVTARELVEAAVERIEVLDGPLNAVVVKWYDDARSAADGVDEQRAAGEPLAAFAGVPTLLKDLWAESAGHPQTNGNVALKDAMPVSDHDSNLVARFRDAGLITLGRTNSPELGSLPVTEPLSFGPTRNPWSTDHTPGGSSGGAAASVAAGMVPIANASDGGGSIRIPASCCGLIGLKTSQGRISLGPDRDESGLSVTFAVSRSMRDTARLLDLVAGPGVGDNVIAPTPIRRFADEVGADPGRLRIGLLARHPLGNRLDPECAAAATGAAKLLEGLGHHVEGAHPAVLEDAGFSARFMAIWATNMSLGIKRCGELAGHELTADEVEPVNWAMSEFASALAAINEYRRKLQGWWADGWDLLLSPTLSEPPVGIGEHDAAPDDPMAGMKRAADFVSFTPPFNTSGQPAISLPTHVTPDGRPVGVQLAAAYGREDVLIRVASQLEATDAFILPDGDTIS